MISLSALGSDLGAAKASLSEDIAIIDTALRASGMGWLETVAGQTGGVRFHVLQEATQVDAFIQRLCSLLADPQRLLPGGYLYLSDLLGDPGFVRQAGRIFAARFDQAGAQAVVTMETKGIPLALSVGFFLGIPVVIVRHEDRVSEGTTVSVNYVSGSTGRLQTMRLARRLLPSGTPVLLIDDFLRGGGTMRGLLDLLHEFDADVRGLGVLVETQHPEQKLVSEYVSLARIATVNGTALSVHPGRDYLASTPAPPLSLSSLKEQI